MPRIRRHGLPPRLLDHLLDRVASRGVFRRSARPAGRLATWRTGSPARQVVQALPCDDRLRGGRIGPDVSAAEPSPHRRRTHVVAEPGDRSAHVDLIALSGSMERGFGDDRADAPSPPIPFMQGTIASRRSGANPESAPRRAVPSERAGRPGASNQPPAAVDCLSGR